MTLPLPADDETPEPPPLWRECVSRGVMLALGGGMAYSGLRGMRYLHDVSAAAPALWLLMVGIALLGSTLVAAGALPVGAVQSLFERFNRPPVTGDRGPGDDEGPWSPRRWWGSEWWWW